MMRKEKNRTMMIIVSDAAYCVIMMNISLCRLKMRRVALSCMWHTMRSQVVTNMAIFVRYCVRECSLICST